MNSVLELKVIVPAWNSPLPTRTEMEWQARGLIT